MSPQAQLLLTGGIEVIIGVTLAWCAHRVLRRNGTRKGETPTPDAKREERERAGHVELLNEVTRLILEHARSVETFQSAISLMAATSAPQNDDADAVDSEVLSMRNANCRFDSQAEQKTPALLNAVGQAAQVFAEVSTSFGNHRRRTAMFNTVLESVPSGRTAVELQELTSESLRDVLETKQRLESELSAAQRLIEQQAAKLRAAESDARIDALTRLPNRRALNEHHDSVHCLFERNGMTYSLLMLDVDKFKSFNDTYGHAAGDAVLQVMAKVLQMQLRLSDKVFRMGGEEFVMVLSATNRQQAVIVAERLRKRIEASAVHFDGCELKFTASIGVAEVETGQSTGELLERADDALYAAKDAGRNCVEVAPTLNSPIDELSPDACV